MKNTFLKNPYIVFAGCAVLASFGAWLLSPFSRGRSENEWGLVLLVFFGLASIVLPLLIQRSVEQTRREP
jgi:predicted permease